jgi:TPP-dependent indolepyruvate ferredoxin oxidoreductase alpha subunit
MAASVCDGSFAFWHQGMGVLASGKTAAVNGGDYTYWHQGMGALRNLGAGSAPTVPDFFLVVDVMPVARRTIVAYGSM